MYYEHFQLLIRLVMGRYRNWLTRNWLEHYAKESRDFSRCQLCPCRSLARMERLWGTAMKKEDHISFLRENTWIWALEPGWALEPTLKQNPDSFEIGQILCSQCFA